MSQVPSIRRSSSASSAQPSQFSYVPNVPYSSTPARIPLSLSSRATCPIFVQRASSARIPPQLSSHMSHIRPAHMQCAHPSDALMPVSHIRPVRASLSARTPQIHPAHIPPSSHSCYRSPSSSHTHTRRSLSRVCDPSCVGRVPARTSSCPSGCRRSKRRDVGRLVVRHCVRHEGRPRRLA